MKDQTGRSEWLRKFCETSGYKKQAIAERLGIEPQHLSYLLRTDIDEMLTRLDRLRRDEANAA